MEKTRNKIGKLIVVILASIMFLGAAIGITLGLESWNKITKIQVSPMFQVGGLD